MSYTKTLIILLGLFFSSCNVQKKCSSDKLLTDQKSINKCIEHFENYEKSHEYNSILHTKSDLNKFDQVIKGNKTILEFYHSSDSKDLMDAWNSTRLLMVFNDLTPDLIGKEIVFPAQNIICSGVEEHSEMRYLFPEVKGSIKILEIQKNSVLIEIQDSLYSVIQVYEDMMEENSMGEDTIIKNGFEYDIHYKVNYTKIRFIKE